jgi:predicted ribosome quality control (RQC) complex YloA/Tae2 family protein
MRLTLDFGKSVDENAALFFEASKKSRKKNAGVKKALSSLSERIGSARSAQDAVTERAVQKRRKRDWFEKFRCVPGHERLPQAGPGDQHRQQPQCRQPGR